MKLEVIRCDVCGVEKKEVNHWYKTWIGQLAQEVPGGSFIMEPWTIGRPGKDICGRKCSIEILERWLATGSLEEKKTLLSAKKEQ